MKEPLRFKNGKHYTDCPDCVGWIEDEEYPTPRREQKDCTRCQGKGEVEATIFEGFSLGRFPFPL